MAKLVTRKKINITNSFYIGYEKVTENNRTEGRLFWGHEEEKLERSNFEPPVFFENGNGKEKDILNDCLVLFVKADGAASIIDSLRRVKHLCDMDANDLFVNTMKMWVGTTEDFTVSSLSKEFARKEVTDSYIKEYDYYVIRFRLLKKYKGCKQDDDSFDRSSFFKQICEDKIELVEISNRLSFDDNIKTEAFSI